MNSEAKTMFDLMKSRRVVRSFTDETVSTDALQTMTRAGRWATSAGNRHVHKFLVTRDPAKIRLIRSFSPGMLAAPPAIVLVITDLEKAANEELQLENDYANYVDVGTATMNMVNMAHALGLGCCPVTSFSKSGVAGVLNLGDVLIPELMIMVGHPKPEQRRMTNDGPSSLTARDLTYWEEVGQHESD